MIRIAVQSKGRLADDTMNLLDEADIKSTRSGEHCSYSRQTSLSKCSI